MENQNFFGIGDALPPLDTDSGVRQVRRASSIILEDPSQTAQRHHADNPSSAVPDNHVEGSDDARQSGDRTPPIRPNILDESPYSSPQGDFSPQYPVSDPPSTPVTNHPVLSWLEDARGPNQRILASQVEPVYIIVQPGTNTRARRLPPVAVGFRDSSNERPEDMVLDGHPMPARREGLQTPTSLNPGSVTPCPSVNHRTRTRDSMEITEDGQSVANLSQTASYSTSPRSVSPMSDIQETRQPEAMEEDGHTHTLANTGNNGQRPPRNRRRRRYVTQRVRNPSPGTDIAERDMHSNGPAAPPSESE